MKRALPWPAPLVLYLSVLTLNALAQGVPEVTVSGSKRSFILSIAMLNQSEPDYPAGVDDSDLDRGDTGLGFSAEYNLNHYFGFELGIFNVNRLYVKESGNSVLVQEARRAHVPLLLRGWLWNNVSLGLGPFVGFRTGGVRQGTSGSDSGLDTQASDKYEYGVESALTLNIAYGDKTGLFLESRWTEPFNQRTGVEINQFSALGGIKVEVDL